MSSNSSKGYKFNIQDGVVSAVYEIKNGRVKLEDMDRDETWTVNGNQVVKTENEHGHLETTVYADVDGDGIYSKQRGSDTDAHREGAGNDDYYYGAVGNDVFDGGAGNDDLYGGEGNDPLSGGDGDDHLQSGAGNDIVDAGSGLDTSTFTGNRANYTITKTTAGYIVKDHVGTDGTDILTNVERLNFADTKIALDFEGSAGQCYRLYQAALSRAPDVGGLTWWVSDMDSGKTLVQIASGFTSSAEFKGLYGENPTNSAFVDALYANVLHRAPDEGGRAYWQSQLDTGLETKEQVLVGFSESAENHINVIGVIQNGMAMNLQ